MAYADQLALKQQRVEQALEPFGAEAPIALEAAGEPWRYRNKAEFSFGSSEGRLVLGFHAAGSFRRIVDIGDCLLMPEAVAALAGDVRRLALASGLPAYHPRSHAGFFRYLIVRSSASTGRLLACLVTAPGDRAPVERMGEELANRHPALAGFCWGQTARLADVAVPEQLQTLWGAGDLEDRVGPFQIRVQPFSFLQVNAEQADRMYQALGRLLGEGGAAAWDLYCGAGMAALYLAQRFQRVYGIDSEPQQLELGRVNAALNGVANIEFHAGRVEEVLLDRRRWLLEAAPEAVVVDPPRAGLHPQALSSVLAGRPRRIAYLSCNLSSLVRDLRLLTSSFPRFRLAAACAFDMFPQTEHVETLVLLER
jgi:23S rRNA (uracil1939-C5)-methyltransferase